MSAQAAIVSDIHLGSAIYPTWAVSQEELDNFVWQEVVDSDPQEEEWDEEDVEDWNEDDEPITDDEEWEDDEEEWDEEDEDEEWDDDEDDEEDE